MSFVSGLIVNFGVSPRIATVPLSLTSISIQDIHDTLTRIEDDVENMIYDSLVSSVGKESLGGGVQVGITMSLLNTKLAFEARGGPTYIQCIVTGGNLTAIDADGVPMDPIEPTAFTQVVLSQSSSATIQNLTLVEQILRNKMEMHPKEGKLKIYEDDGVGVLMEAAVYEDYAAKIPYRGHGVERRERLV